MVASILHIAPSHVDLRPGQGSHKDVAARRDYLMATGARYVYVSATGDEPSELDRLPGGFVASHVLIEYSYLHRVAREARRRFPDAFIAVRAHNIEPLHEWDLSEWSTPIVGLRNLYGIFRLLGCDWRTARTVDHIYVIAPNEARSYWRWLGVGGRVSWLPYISPPELRQAAGSAARNVIACLPGGARSQRTIDLVNRFVRFAVAARGAGWSERFVITGDIAPWGIEVPPTVERAGYVDDLPSFYRSVKAVAVLSPLGYGFKTTIADAIWSGAKALVHPAIGAELPEELVPYCVSVRSPCLSELERTRQALRAAPSRDGACDALMRRFEREMRRFIAGGVLAEPAPGSRTQA